MNLNKSGKIKFAAEVVNIASDEKKLKALIARVAKILEKQVKSLGIGPSGRERLRDAIRSETFASSVIAAYQPSKGIV